MEQQELVSAMSDLIDHYVDAGVREDAVLRGLAVNAAYVLATLMRKAHALPVDVDVVLTEFCQELREMTLAIIRDKDAATE